MTEASGGDASPKSVAHMDVSTMVEKIRDRRDAVLDGKVTPSTVPNFSSTSIRRSLVSIDDEEFETYRVEVTTDNVVKQQVPPRFSQSDAEEYLAEFDMVDTRGEVVPLESTSTPVTPTRTASPGIKLKKGGKFAPFISGSVSRDSGSLKEPKKSKKSGDGMPPRTEKKVGGPLASLRNRTYSHEDTKTGIEVTPSSPLRSATPPRTIRDLVNAPPAKKKTVADPECAPPKATDAPEAVFITLPPSQSGGIFSSLRKRTSSSKGSSLKKTPRRVAPKSAQAEKSTPTREQRHTQHENGTYAEPSAEWDGVSEKMHKSFQERKKGHSDTTKSAAAPVETNPAAPTIETKPAEEPMPKVADKSAPYEENINTPDTTKPAKLEDDDTRSTAESSTESVPNAKPPKTFPCEAAVEGLLEKFFDKVTCSCIHDRCVPEGCGTKREKDVPDYMVVEIQKIHKKAQAKKAEIAEKKKARRSKKTEKAQDKDSKKKDKGGFEMKPASPERKAVPTYEWGEKVLEQDSVTTASTHPQLASGITVGEFLHRRFDMFERSMRKGDESTDEESQSEESEVEEDTVEEFMNGAILNIAPVKDIAAMESAPERGAAHTIAARKGRPKDHQQRVIILSQAHDEDGSESLLDGDDDGDESLLEGDEDDDSEYTTELIQVDFDPSKLGNTTDADMYLAREVLRRYAEITGISLDELIEDVVDESLASVTLDAYGFPTDREGSVLSSEPP